jgi:hypothetical protein
MEHTGTRRLRSRSHVKTRRQHIKLNTDAVTAILAPIYSELAVSKAAGHHNLTYGEIEWETLKYIAEYAAKTPAQKHATKFYDLGCGRGRSILYMGLTGPFEQSVGIEVLPERVSLAKEALNTLKASIPTAGSKVRIYEASFLNPAFKYRDARVVFMSNLCFDSETQAALFRKLENEMPSQSLLFCTKVPSPVPAAFKLLSTERKPMSWTPTSEFNILQHV